MSPGFNMKIKPVACLKICSTEIVAAIFDLYSKAMKCFVAPAKNVRNGIYVGLDTEGKNELCKYEYLFHPG